MPRFVPLPTIDFAILDAKSAFVLLQSNKFDHENHSSFLFVDPVDQIEAFSAADVPGAFERIERYAQSHYLAGFFSYELGYPLDPFWGASGRSERPLIRLGVFDRAITFDHRTGHCSDTDFFQHDEYQRPYSVTGLALDCPESDYGNRIQRIKRHIEAGDTYQVNFTSKYTFIFDGCPYTLYRDLTRQQEVAYNAFIKFDGSYILSISPELFFRRDGQTVTTKPMKGTMPRGRNLREDERQIRKLASDRKNQSENVMIVDLLRNDLGRVSQTGSVRVTELFSVERFNTLLQMTSTIEGELRTGISWHQLFQSIFPCGSVTGAPKLRTMQIIRELEASPRGVYTGAIGFIAPGARAVFNVPIRTLTLTGSSGEMGVGSGVIYDSEAAQEYQECRLKAQFLVEQVPQFSLIESILWDGSYRSLPAHLRRLRDSARYFDFDFDEKVILRQLQAFAETLPHATRQKVRLLLHKDGRVSLEHTELTRPGAPGGAVTISEKRTSSLNRFLFHKTTNRAFYEREREKALRDGFCEVLFLNEKGQITEGAISNIFIRKGDAYFTPPVECGLLNGIFRQQFLNRTQNAFEQILYPTDLAAADEIFLTNAVRGMTRVHLSRHEMEPCTHD